MRAPIQTSAAIPRLVPYEVVFESGGQKPAQPDTVTVCVSLYNYASFIAECLASVLNQLHQNLELIVVDDASSDESLQFAHAWLLAHGNSFSRVQLVRHLRNQGLAEARNTGFLCARTGYVFVLDADNALYPRAIARLYEALRSGEFEAAYTQLEFFGAERRLGLADIWSRELLAMGNYVDAMALVSKAAWKAVGGYSHIEGGWEDYDFWCKFIEHGLNAVYVPEILCRYRVHSASMLRTETHRAYDELVVRMIKRHPWLTVQ
jgi:glycosyltransferase involved in cell wall biosynthesis